MPATNTSSKKRVTLHNQRTSRRTGKAFTTKHNDRNFDTTKSKHIDFDRLENNLYWRYDAPSPYQPKKGVKLPKTFDKAEDEFYKAVFSTYLKKKNERRASSRHKKQTMKQYRKNRITCPEETLFYIGNRNNHVEPELLTEVLEEYIEWMKKNYPQVHVLDWALHCDEEGAPHIHMRHVYIAYDENGVARVNQEATLTQMGVEKSRGKLTKDKDGNLVEKDRYNNRKVTFTKACREKLQELALARGLEIETTPRDPREQGRSLNEYKAQQDRAAADAKLAEVRTARELISEARSLKDLVAANTQIMLAVDAALKGLTFKPLATADARRAARETLEILGNMEQSVDIISNRLADVDDLTELRLLASKRIRRARNACKRAIESAKLAKEQAGKEEAARIRKEADDYRQRQIHEANEMLAVAAKKAAALDAREEALDAEADQRAHVRVQEHMSKLRTDESSLRSKIAMHRGSVTTLEGEINALTTKKTALETEIKHAKQQITPITTALCRKHSVDELRHAAAVIDQAKRTHDSGASVSVEDAVLKALDAQAQQRSRSTSYGTPESP